MTFIAPELFRKDLPDVVKVTIHAWTSEKVIKYLTLAIGEESKHV